MGGGRARCRAPGGLALARRQSHVPGQRGLLARTRAGRPGPWDQGVREGGLGAELLQTAGHRAAGTSVRKEAPHRTRRPSRAATPSPGPSDGAPPNRAHGFTQQTACIATFEFIMFYRMKTAPSSPGVTLSSFPHRRREGQTGRPWPQDPRLSFPVRKTGCARSASRRRGEDSGLASQPSGAGAA